MSRNRVLDLQEFNEQPTKEADEGVALQALMYEEQLQRTQERLALQRHFAVDTTDVNIAQEGFLGNMFGKKDHGPNGHSLDLLRYLENKLKTAKVAEEEIEYRAHGVLAHLANKNKFEAAIANLSSAMKMAKDYEQQMLTIWTSLISALETFSKDDNVENLRKDYSKLAVAFKPASASGWHNGPILKDQNRQETAHYNQIDSTESYIFEIVNNGTQVLKHYSDKVPASRIAAEARWINEPYSFARTISNEFKHLFRIRKNDAEGLQPKLLGILDEAITHYAEYDSYYKKLDDLATRMVDVHNRDKTRLDLRTTQAIINRLCEAQGLMDATILQTGSLIRQYVTLVY